MKKERVINTALASIALAGTLLSIHYAIEDYTAYKAREAAEQAAIIETAQRLESFRERQRAAKMAQETAYTVEPMTAEVMEEVTEEPGTELVSLGEFVVSHYCPCTSCCNKDDGITATGTTATEGRTVAVDPDVIPYGSEVFVRYADGTEHTYIAEDCGGAIKQNRLDVFMNSHEAALIEGMKTAEVWLVKE